MDQWARLCASEAWDAGSILAGELKLHMLHGSRKKKSDFGGSLAVQWLRLHASNAGGAGLIPGQGTQIPHTSRSSQKKKERKKLTNPGDLDPAQRLEAGIFNPETGRRSVS